jgi:hypothetical protein
LKAIIELIADAGGTVNWGDIEGTISDQLDLASALNNKVDVVSGKGLSENDFTNTLKIKLGGIQAEAEVNVNADWNATSGDAQILNKPTIPSIAGLVPYMGATANVDLGTFDLDAAKGTFTHSGSTDTLTATHSSGSGIGLLITKGGSNEGLKVNKTSGSGNAATIIGTLEATTLVKTGGTSSQYLMADGSVSTSMIPRVQSVTSSATVTALSTNDLVTITAQAVGLTLANPTGTFTEGQSLIIRIKDNGTPQTIGYGTNFRAIGVTSPTTTVANKTTYIGCIYNSTDNKFDIVGVCTEA